MPAVEPPPGRHRAWELGPRKLVTRVAHLVPRHPGQSAGKLCECPNRHQGRLNARMRWVCLSSHCTRGSGLLCLKWDSNTGCKQMPFISFHRTAENAMQCSRAVARCP